MRLIFSIFLLAVCGCNYLIKPKSKIVDNNFANAIRRQCPMCIDTANYLTKHADTLTVLNVSTSYISSLEGFRFKNLLEFDCSYNQITALPENLPPTLRVLRFNTNEISRLPDIKFTHLEEFVCDYNPLNSLPDNYLPNTVTHFRCIGNNLDSLPKTLPTSLTYFNCFNNNISRLPDNLPPNLNHLDCSYNQITQLPKLPDSLQFLYCSFNLLEGLPEPMPSGLLEIYDEENPFNTEPFFPKYSDEDD